MSEDGFLVDLAGVADRVVEPDDHKHLSIALDKFNHGDPSDLRLVHRTKGTDRLLLVVDLPSGVSLALAKVSDNTYVADRLLDRSVLVRGYYRRGHFRRGHRRPATPAPVKRATTIASWIAGSGRSHLRGEWTALLAGDPAAGVVVTSRRQFALALGFLIAAARMRARDAAAPFWRPVDWVLSADRRTEAFIALPPGLLAIYIEHHDGLHVLLTEGWGWVGGCGVATYWLTRWTRRLRGIELASRAPSADE
ncbi:hypothetical protein ABT039_05700 [Streptomyces lasiicapitis]|uniref:hypothetical protein n=1 Tax=Streptomyces lasiicapitis TaxID=1923961 RepID=UPI00332B0726